EGAFPRRLDRRGRDWSAVEGRAGGILLVDGRPVALFTSERIDFRRDRVHDLGVRAGGDSALRRGVHGRVRTAAARQAGGRAGGAGAEDVKGPSLDGAGGPRWTVLGDALWTVLGMLAGRCWGPSLQRA